MMKMLCLILCLSLTSFVMASNLGKETYEIACHACHAPQVAPGINAPAAFNKKAWAARFKQAEVEVKNNPSRFKTPMDYLLYKVSVGKKLMPHGGLCKEADVPNKNCSDKAIAAAINYMSGSMSPAQ